MPEDQLSKVSLKKMLPQLTQSLKKASVWMDKMDSVRTMNKRKQ